LSARANPSPTPYLALAGVCLAALAGTQFFPSVFFPGLPLWVSGLIWDLAALACATRVWFLDKETGKRRSAAMLLLELSIRDRDSQSCLTGPSADTAQRTLGRVIRNADEDLREINPDFTAASLRRLSGFLPRLLDEIQTETDAKIRLGVVGAYLGETACRLWDWQWNFRSDPALKQFNYLASTLERKGAQADPFGLALEFFSCRLKPKDLIQKLGKKEGEAS
jgi:hypothetical protein